MSQRTSQFLALGGLLVLILLYAGTNLGLFGPSPIGSTSDSMAALIVPEGYAFAIWGPIYLGLFAFPIVQFLQNRADHPAWIEVRKWYAANVVANGIWLVLASYNVRWFTVVVIAFMLISLLRINVLLDRIEADRVPVNFWVTRLVFYLYFAWITVATVLNVANDLKNTGWGGGPLDEITWSVVMLLVTAGIAAFTALRFRNAAYPAVVVWALAAIAVRHAGNLPTLVYVSAGLAVGFALLAIGLLSRRRSI